MTPEDPGAKSSKTESDKDEASEKAEGSGAGSPEAPTPIPDLSPQARFLLGNATWVAMAAFFTFCAIAVAPSMFLQGPPPTQELSGHFSGATLSQGKTKLDNVYTFTVKEYPQAFQVTKMREIDQMVFKSESHGAFFQFEVETARLMSQDQVLKVKSLKSLKNVYLASEGEGGMAKSRGIAVSFFIIFASVVLFIFHRLRTKRKKMTPETLAKLRLDPLAVLVATTLSRFRYFKGLLALHAQMTAYTGERIKTEKPTHLKAVEFLVRSGKLNIQGPDGKTALLIALEKGAWDAADALIRVGADVNLTAQNGVTPLMIVAAAGNVPMAHKLLQAGASVLLENSQKQTALATAQTKEKNTAMVELLSKTLEIQKQFFAALREKKMDGLSRALGMGAKASLIDENRKPALAIAISGGFTEGVRRLVAGGALVTEDLWTAAQALENPEIQAVVGEAWEKSRIQLAQKERAETKT